MATPVLTQKLCKDLNAGKIVASEVGATITTVNKGNLRQYMYELCSAVAKGQLKASKFTTGIKAAGLSAESIASHLVDTLWFTWLELKEVEQELFVDVVKSCMEEGLVTKRALQETGEVDFLEKSGIVANAATWRNKEIRINTRQVYLQQKYNLYREESEGYSKVITIANAQGKDGISKEQVPTVAAYFRSLIGYFDLDPNRVFDIILEAYESQPENGVFLELLPYFPHKNTACLLGHKLTRHHEPGAEPTPLHLPTVAAALLKAKNPETGESYLTMDELYAYLSPADGDLVAACTATQAAMGSEKAKASPLSQEVKPGVSYSGRRTAINSASVLAASATQQAHLDLGHLVELESKDAAADNQKLKLLQVSHWDEVQRLTERLETLGVQPAADPGVAASLRSALWRLISPEYEKLARSAPLSQRAKMKSPPSKRPSPVLPDAVVKLLCLLGPHLHADIKLFVKTLRTIHGVVAARHESSERVVLTNTIVRLASDSLLPCLEFTRSNPAAIEETWSLLRELPQEARYRAYAAFHTNQQEAPLLAAADAHLRASATKIVEKLCGAVAPPERGSRTKEKDAKEEIKKLSKALAKVVNTAPVPACDAILQFMEKDSSTATAKGSAAAPPALEHLLRSSNVWTRLSLDIFQWSILRRLTLPGRNSPTSGTAPDWAHALANVSCHFCKRFQSFDMRSVLRVCLGAIRAARAFPKDSSPAKHGGDVTMADANKPQEQPPTPACYELLVLQSLMEGMAESSAPDLLTPDQVNSEIAGPVLKTEAPALQAEVSPRTQKGLQRNKTRLLEALKSDVLKGTTGSYAKMLLLELAHTWAALQQRGRGAKALTGAGREGLLETMDRCRAALLHLSHLLVIHMDAAAYQQLLMPVTDLHQSLSLGPDLIFHLWRPALPKFDAKEDSDDEDEPAEHGSGVALTLAIGTLIPVEALQALSQPMYTAFWSLKLSDLMVPQKLYESVRMGLMETNKQVQATRGGSSSEQHALRARAEALKDMVSKLPKELETRRKHVRNCSRWLQVQKDSFLSDVEDHKRTPEVFQQICLLPRCILSPEDAIYCFRFVEKLHKMKTPYFNMVLFWDKCMRNTLFLLHCCTPGEVSNLGLFLAETLRQVERYKADQKLYALECASSPGFLKALSGTQGEHLSWESFKKLCAKWQRLIVQTLRAMLKSQENTLVANALALFTCLAAVPCPATRGAFQAIKSDARNVKDGKGPESLKAVAAACVKEMEKVDDKSLVADLNVYQGLQPKPAGPGAGGAARPPAGTALGHGTQRGATGDRDQPQDRDTRPNRPSRSREPSPHRMDDRGDARPGRREGSRGREWEHPGGSGAQPPGTPELSSRPYEPLVRSRELESSPGRNMRGTPPPPGYGGSKPSSPGPPGLGGDRGPRRGGSSLRPEAPAFEPHKRRRDGEDTGRAASPPRGGDREAANTKRPRMDSHMLQQGGNGGKDDRKRDRGEAGGDHGHGGGGRHSSRMDRNAAGPPGGPADGQKPPPQRGVRKRGRN